MARKRKRPTESYLDAAKRLAQFYPSLKPYATQRRKNLDPWQKGHIARIENIVRGVYNLHPLTPAKAKTLKPFLYQPVTTVKSGKNIGKLIKHRAIPAIQLANTEPEAKVLPIDQHAFAVVSNGRTFVHWSLSDTSPRTLIKGAQAAFEFSEESDELDLGDEEEEPESYEIERVIELAKLAFEQPQTKGVYLYSENGRVGGPMKSIGAFVRWVQDHYSGYKDTERWVRGIAILVADQGEKITTAEWASHSKPPLPPHRPRKYYR